MVMPALFGGFGNIQYYVNSEQCRVTKKLLLIASNNNNVDQTSFNLNFCIGQNSTTQKHISHLKGLNKPLDDNTVLVSNLKNNFIKDKELLGSYLAGLIEGDGSIIVPIKTESKQQRCAFIKICFNMNDYELGLYLQRKLGGRILPNKNKTYFEWIISKQTELLCICELINGFFRTPKIEALHRLIYYFNSKYHTKLELKNLDQSNLDSNAWLAGFTDADGNFSLNITKRIQSFFRIELKQSYTKNVSQSLGDFSFFDICSKLASFFGVTLYSRTRLQGNKQFYSYMIISHSMKSHSIVRNYFDKYPLFSSKYLNYQDWRLVYVMQLNKEHLTIEGRTKCIDIKRRFNNSRRVFHWSHLKHFYI